VLKKLGVTKVTPSLLIYSTAMLGAARQAPDAFVSSAAL